jgi:hydrogenase/urease accessory protein HupE
VTGYQRGGPTRIQQGSSTWEGVGIARLIAVSRWLASAVAALALNIGGANAHLASDSYLRVEVGADNTLTGQWDIAIRDLDVAVGLDADADGAVTWGELRIRRGEIERYAFERLRIGNTAGACTLRSTELLVDHHAGEAFAVLRFAGSCPSGGRLSLEYRLLFDIDPTHRGLLTVVEAGAVRSDVLSPQRQVVDLSGTTELGRFFVHGLEHILVGYDHLLFVAVLLIVASLRRAENGAWVPVDSLPRVLIEVVKILTGFTVAHAATMTLAVLGRIDVPARIVEPAVALTIILTASDNLRPILPRLRWAVAFVFGLIHGLAFATALEPMQLPPWRLAAALLSFNLGIEAGQLALAALLVPFAFWFRRAPLYPRLIAGVSVAAILLGSVWLVDRLFLLDLFRLAALE